MLEKSEKTITATVGDNIATQRKRLGISYTAHLDFFRILAFGTF